ncbi:glycosyl hydrolase family 65 protein [Ornithinimicrobium humiphilum]|uniref:Alpha,alpha-trehalose phosphorylase n=1 Tax=Ornithinimicrobium humiphilum TaxID=125288 RepID=A0A543KML5_9MICO|nr:glycosyl hydrolase family 65 protein [Ornithinimicrobium humiphilum]TQM96301.1 alpha,alpha-trehalose phosphorylase [Ornithinimicrobium humiphilum]
MHLDASPWHRPPQPVDPLDRTRFPVDPWRFVERAYDVSDLGLTETLFSVSNGYLGLRGNVEEGRDTHTHGTFVNGFHETWPIRHAEEAYGLARVGQTIVNVPDPKTIKLYVDDEPLLLSTADIETYERALDMRQGMLRRDLVWRTSSGKRVRISSTRLTSVVERHLAVMTLEVEMLDGDASLVISSGVLNRQDGSDEYQVSSAAMGEGADPRRAESFEHRVLQPRLHELRDDRLLLGYRCANSGMTIATLVHHQIETEDPWTERITIDEDQGKHVYEVAATRGNVLRVEKLVAVHTSRGVPPSELADRCERTLDRAVSAGVDQLQQEHADLWRRFWTESDVEVEGHPEVQQAIRWNLFQLGQATIRAGSHGIPAKGLTGSGYGGHYFWDTECYVVPFLTYTHPQAARNALRFRHGMLDDARRRAAEMSQFGALYPWRTINGQEASAYFQAGTAQYHINADIAYALMKYVRATGDRQFLLNQGVDILVETARMWADLGFWHVNGGGDRSFHIHGVTGPDEYNTVVNDNFFTNVMAQHNLQAAVQTVRELQETDPVQMQRATVRLGLDPREIADWERCAARMHIPYDEDLGIHPQDSQFLDREVWDLNATPADRRPLLLHYHPLVIYRYQVLKQADVVLALYLCGDHFTLEEKLADFDYYDPITTGDSSLSAVVQAIVAAEVGHHELALRYFYAGLFVDLADRHGNTVDGVHIASTGGVWSALVGGFGGMRDHDGRLSFDPRLPESWPSLTWRMRWQLSRLRVRLEAEAIIFVVEVGEPVTLSVRGQQVTVGADEVRVPLAGQGPRRIHEPQLQLIGGTPTSEGPRTSDAVPGGAVPHSWSHELDDPTSPIPVRGPGAGPAGQVDPVT